MPYRNIPPRRRPLFEKCAGLWMLVIVAMGVHGLHVATERGHFYIGQLVYGLLLIGLGVSAFAAWWKGARQPELIFMTGIGVLSLVHGSALWFMSEDSGAQAGLRILAAGVGTLSWVGLRHEFGIPRSDVVAHVEAIEGRHDDREG